MGLKDGLIAYYKFDETSGTTCNDSHTSDLDGTINGATINQTGKLIKCYTFDGTNNRVDLSSGNNFLGGENYMSFSVWINTNDLSNKRWVFGTENGLNYNDSTIQLYIYDNGYLTISVYNGTSAFATTYPVSSMSINTWYHIVGTLDDDYLRLYVNGTEINNVSRPSSATINTTTNTMVIGRLGTYNAYYWNGEIDELAFWNKTLTTTEITALYNSGSGLSYDSFTTGNYIQESSSGRLHLEKNLFGKKINNLFRKETGEGEIQTKTGEIKVIIPNSSYNYSSISKTKTTTTYTTLISKAHKSKTGKVVITANLPIVANPANGDITVRLTESGTLINGTEHFGIWSSGDGSVKISLSGYHEVDKEISKTYALEWKQGEAEINIETGGIWGAYNIFVQDII